MLFSARSAKKRFRRKDESRKSKRFNNLCYEVLQKRQLLATIVANAALSGTQDWTAASTWIGGVVPGANDRAIIPQDLTVTLNAIDHTVKELVVHGTLTVDEHAGVDRSLTADWIHVNSGGLFQVGTASDRYDAAEFTVTLTGENTGETFTVETATGSLSISDNNSFLMAAMGGQLQFFGKEKLTYTRLAETANAGANNIRVHNAVDRNYDGQINSEDGALNWEAGDQIVVASSTKDYQDEDVRLVTGVFDLGDGTSLLTLNSPLSHRHNGEVETYNNDTRSWSLDLQAEVAILNRNVKIQGLASHDTDSAFGDRANFSTTPGDGDGFGGHTMIMETAGDITIDSVQFDRMGQTARLGRYPIHWHLAGDRFHDVLINSSITNSNNRGLTIHGTHGVRIEGVVLHDIHGHGFFMEDGVETDNQYIANIAFGVHQVGRTTPSSGQPDPNPNDPFVVDTHDHVGQNVERFLSSAAYWITNPDNIWIGNISAGSEGTGFWFILPDSAIGESASDPQYSNVRPDRTNLQQFDHNSSHSSPAGLNFDRGSDIEVPVGATLKDRSFGDAWLPPSEPQINNYTAYQHGVAIYHRGLEANFHENQIADSTIGTFITFTQRLTNTLFVGHSRTNADPSGGATGHSLYDGANALDGSHFAGFAASNAHMFRIHGAIRRDTSHVLSNTSFEDDGSANHVSIGTRSGGSTHNDPLQQAAGALYDLDGTLTGHVGGGAGYSVVTNHPFFYDSNDFRPAGWNAVVSDEVSAYFQVDPVNQNADFRLTAPDGDQATTDGKFATHLKTDDGDYIVDFPEGINLVAAGFDINFFIIRGPNAGSTVVRFDGVAATLRPQNTPRAASLAELRNATTTTYGTFGGDLYVKFFTASSKSDDLIFAPVTNAAPDAVDDTAATSAGVAIQIPVLDNDSDPDDDPLQIIGSSIGSSVVVADYQGDYQTDNFPTGWQYLYNSSGAFGDPSVYSPLTFEAWRYHPTTGNLPYLTSGSAHPGDGTASDPAGIERHAIAAWTVEQDGVYSITDSVVSNSNQFSNGVNVKVHVTGRSVSTLETIGSQEQGSFDTQLGFLTAGQTIYVALGSGLSAGGDSSNPFDFSITRESGAANGSVQINPDGTITYTPAVGSSGSDSFVYTVSDGVGGTDTATVNVTINEPTSGSVAGQYLFYKDSAFDTASPRDAIATDKSAALPGQATHFGNYSSYTRGINGIIVDVQGFSAAPFISDFEFHVGNDNAPVDWPELTAATGIEFTSGAGAGGSDQIVLTWADNAIENQWLRVTVKATANTNLDNDHVFYFGNQIGDTNGDKDINDRVRVNSFDTIATILNSAPLATTTIDDVHDVDRSRRVNSVDLAMVLVNQEISGLQMFTPLINPPISPPPVPVIVSAAAAAPSPEADTLVVPSTTEERVVVAPIFAPVVAPSFAPVVAPPTKLPLVYASMAAESQTCVSEQDLTSKSNVKFKPAITRSALANFDPQLDRSDPDSILRSASREANRSLQKALADLKVTIGGLSGSTKEADRDQKDDWFATLVEESEAFDSDENGDRFNTWEDPHSA